MKLFIIGRIENAAIKTNDFFSCRLEALPQLLKSTKELFIWIYCCITDNTNRLIENIERQTKHLRSYKDND